MIGPNVRRLISERAAQVAVSRVRQPGQTVFGTIAAGIVDGQFSKDMRDAAKWVEAALLALHRAPGGEKWPTDEEMAGEVLRLLEERKTS